jgi:hypothetical protein
MATRRVAALWFADVKRTLDGGNLVLLLVERLEGGKDQGRTHYLLCLGCQETTRQRGGSAYSLYVKDPMEGDALLTAQLWEEPGVELMTRQLTGQPLDRYAILESTHLHGLDTLLLRHREQQHTVGGGGERLGAKSGAEGLAGGAEAGRAADVAGQAAAGGDRVSASSTGPSLQVRCSEPAYAQQGTLAGVAGAAVAPESYATAATASACRWSHLAELTDSQPTSGVVLRAAQRSPVVRVEGFLAPSEVAAVHALAAQMRADGSAGRERRGGSPMSWETAFLHTGRKFSRALPALAAKLRELAWRVDGGCRWKLLPAAGDDACCVGARCTEYHVMGRGGALAEPQHHDAGSLITVDVMLSRPRDDFQGGEFRTLEPCSMLQPDGALIRG